MTQASARVLPTGARKMAAVKELGYYIVPFVLFRKKVKIVRRMHLRPGSAAADSRYQAHGENLL
jgi:hypothetical protein